MQNVKKLILDGSKLSLDEVMKVALGEITHISLSQASIRKIKKSRKIVTEAVQQNKTIYGVTTGFGSFKNIKISHKNAEELQLNILRSHATGVGKPFDEVTVRAVILLRANSLAKGYSGVTLETIEALLDLLRKNIVPYVPEQGSVGSSGDLAPLCHIMLTLVGEGECIENNKRIPSKKMLAKKKLKPITLSYKEGLALSNGTNVQTAVLAIALYRAKKLIDIADFTSALTVEILMGSKKPFDKRVSLARGQVGQIESASNIWSILDKSPIVDSHENCDRIQDSYSLRCIPQVHGASRDSISHVYNVLIRELNAATDNPLIFEENKDVISAGNFHGEPIAQASDILKIAITEIANISERRTAKMIDPATNDDLPAYLIDPRKGGLHSGLMIPQYVAAALVSENKVLAHPASVDSIPTSANQEDHVSMGTIAARQAQMCVTNALNVIAIELLNNTQAYEFRKPIKLSPYTEWLYNEVRKKVKPIRSDRPFYKDIEEIVKLIESEKINDYIKKNIKNWKH